MIKRILLYFILCCTLCVCAYGESAQEELRACRFLAGANYTRYEYLYERRDHSMTPAPEGYDAFYLSSYMRHGSRWLTGSAEYTYPLQVLRYADSLKVLTRDGRRLFREVQTLRALSPDEKTGVLTETGLAQHHAIATRMCERYPSIFDATAEIEARSSHVARCVKSMAEEVEVIQRLSGQPWIEQQSGTREIQHALANWQQPTSVRRALAPSDSISRAFTRAHVHPERLMSLWFKRELPQVDAYRFVDAVYRLAENMQSHDFPIPVLRYFTDEELYDIWRCKNVEWYLKHACAPQTSGMAPFREQYLLRDFVEEADRCLNTPGFHGASLRFGHDGCIMPLMCLMQIEEVSAVVNNLDTLDRVWRTYEIIPMAANLQVVFYRRDGAEPQDILVRLALNEREVHLPLPARNGVYYRWDDVRRLWTKPVIND